MAAAGYTPISLYYSTTASTAPLAANLVAGELALNTLDEKLYFKNSAGTVKLLASNSGSAGSVTSVAQSFTGGIISVGGSPITSSGTLALTVAGTSGGIPYFSTGTTWATSAALAASAIVLGGGAGAAPATTTTGTGVVTALGVNVGTAGAVVVNGGALGTPSSGTVTNLTGTASININGTVGATTANTGAFTTLSATGNTTLGDAVTDTMTFNGQFVTGTVLRSAQTATNTLALAAYDVDGTAYVNLITLTASNTPTLTLTSTGVGTINNMSVGATTASTGAFTTLSASSTVSGTGFSTYLASPPAIGGTTAAAGSFTSLTSTSASGILTRAAATQDGIEFIGRAGGTTSLKVTFTPTTLTASRTLTLPDNTGTLLTSGAAVTVAQGGTGQTSYTDGQLLIGNTAGNTLTKAVLTAGTGVTITNGSGAITIAATGSGGTVTSVAQSFTGGLISVAGSPITGSGTLALTVAGTSGGIPYFSTASTWATSAALAANAIVIGGGAGVAPATTTTGTGVVTALGVNTGTAGAFVVNGGALGTPSSGTVTNLTGTASININGTVGATTANTGAFTSITSTSASGILTRAAATQDGVEFIGRAGGTTSLKVTFTPTTLTASRTLTLPDNTGTILTTGAVVTVAQGGTGQTTAGAAFNALSPITSTGDLIIGNGVNSATRLGIGLNGYILSSNGTTASWTAPAGGGASISNDTATSTNVYPLFAAATSGTPTTIYTGNAKYLYKPSTGELTSSAMISSNGIQINANTIATSYTIATGNNGLSAGPVSVSTGITVTVSTGSVWTVV